MLKMAKMTCFLEVFNLCEFRLVQLTSMKTLVYYDEIVKPGND